MALEKASIESYISGLLTTDWGETVWSGFRAEKFRDENGEKQYRTDLDKDKTYYLYCRSGNRSGQAARIMKSKGFDNVYNVGGFEDLVRFGFESDK